MNTPWVESPFFEEILLNKTNLSKELIQICRDYHENGYVVIPNFFNEKMVEDLKSDMDNIGFNPNTKINNNNNTRILDFWRNSETSKKIACDDKVLNILETLYEREPIPFQTLNFKFGTGQRAHSDTIHFNSIPSKYMCGVWVALEDITPDNGAVFYYPKSHKLPEYNFSHFETKPNDPSNVNYFDYENFIEKIINNSNFEKKHFYAKKGDILIWSSNIIHGGSNVLNKQLTRYSQVTHYFFSECLYYTPLLSNMVTNELYLRNKLENIKTGKRIKLSYNGHKIKYFQTKRKLFVLNNSNLLQRFIVFIKGILK
jgi:ectoine hydroxylase-related dioxygenase (phytanoyl-CoA dioxygenase family)